MKLASTSKGAAAFHLLRKSPIVLVTCPYVDDHYEISFKQINFKLSDEYAYYDKINRILKNDE